MKLLPGTPLAAEINCTPSLAFRVSTSDGLATSILVAPVRKVSVIGNGKSTPADRSFRICGSASEHEMSTHSASLGDQPEGPVALAPA